MSWNFIRAICLNLISYLKKIQRQTRRIDRGEGINPERQCGEIDRRQSCYSRWRIIMPLALKMMMGANVNDEVRREVQEVRSRSLLHLHGKGEGLGIDISCSPGPIIRNWPTKRPAIQLRERSRTRSLTREFGDKRNLITKQ